MTESDTSSEEFRHLCETYYVARMEPNRRTEYMNGVEKKRGLAAANRLRNDVADVISQKAEII